MALMAPQEGLCLQNRTLVEEEFPQLTWQAQGFFISVREPVWAGWRPEADIGVTSEPFVSSCKGAGRWDPRVLGLGASIHLPTFPCVLLGSRNSLVLQGGRVLGVGVGHIALCS